jgi:hypothetical protein
MLYTRQVRDTVDFYITNLGFTCVGYDEHWGWATVSRDEIEIMFSVPNEHEPFSMPKFTGSLYIRTDKVEEIWRELKDHAVISYPIETLEYGMREFGIYDFNGYLLQFGMPVD